MPQSPVLDFVYVSTIVLLYFRVVLWVIFCLSFYCSSNKKIWKYQREVIRIRKSKKNRQHNGQEKKYKRTNNDLQDIHIKLKIE